MFSEEVYFLGYGSTRYFPRIVYFLGSKAFNFGPWKMKWSMLSGQVPKEQHGD
jgi:hypothetical protein